MPRLFRFALAGFASLAATPALAQTSNEPTETAAQPPASSVEAEPAIKISGGATLASQYRFRGISLSDEEFAVQGIINLTHESGFYAGVWASSLDGFGELGGSNVELDLYGGYKAEIADGLTLDGGLLYYAYPGSTGGDFEFFEPYAKVSGAIGPVSTTAGIAFAPSQDALADNSNVYVFGDVSAGIPGLPLTAKAHLGYSKGDTPLSLSGEYFDWLLGADYVWRNLTLGAAYVDTDLNAAEAALGGATKDIVDRAVVFSLTANF